MPEETKAMKLLKDEECSNKCEAFLCGFRVLSCGFSPGAKVSSHFPKRTHVRLSDGSKLTLGVSMSVDVVFSMWPCDALVTSPEGNPAPWSHI